MAKARLLFYLKPQNLEIYGDKNEGFANLAFSPEVVNHQEILNLDLFLQSLEKFLTQISINGSEVFILLSKPLIYSKQFEYSQTGVDRRSIEDFIDSIPFDNGQIATLELTDHKLLIVLATNRFFYQKIVDLCQNLGAKVDYVVPDTIFNPSSEVLSISDVKKIFNDKKNLDLANFLAQISDNPKQIEAPIKEDEDMEEEEKSSFLGNKMLTIGGILLILVGLIILGLQTKIINIPWNQNGSFKSLTNPAQPSSPPTISIGSNFKVVVSSPSASPNQSKDKITTQIINGTGIAGQSTKVKDLLLKLGYKNIDLGITQISGDPKTTVNFTSQVSSDYKKELTLSLSDIFTSIATKEASPSAKYDITITTGVYK